MTQGVRKAWTPKTGEVDKNTDSYKRAHGLAQAPQDQYRPARAHTVDTFAEERNAARARLVQRLRDYGYSDAYIRDFYGLEVA